MPALPGIVTLEDIVEEIVGEIRDEYDQGEEHLYQIISPDEYSFIGRIDLEDVNELLGTHLTKDIADTLGGYIYGKLVQARSREAKNLIAKDGLTEGTHINPNKE